MAGREFWKVYRKMEANALPSYQEGLFVMGRAHPQKRVTVEFHVIVNRE